MNKKYYAKSPRADGSQVTVSEHLQAVSALAAEHGGKLGMKDEAGIAGLLHDFGKYSDAFQEVLLGLRTGIDHASAGAAFLLERARGGSAEGSPILEATVEAINAHHDGLIGFPRLRDCLRNNLHADLPETSVNKGKTYALSGTSEYLQAWKCFLAENKLPSLKFLRSGKWEDRLIAMLRTRMLFSCLVDADYSVSALEEREAEAALTTSAPLDASACLSTLLRFRDALRCASSASGDVNRMRELLFEECGRSGEGEASGLFTLTAPTGMGKTLALLHFALRHCIAKKKRRIVIVLPFLTLAEQNTEVYESIMPSVLVDHSQSKQDDGARELAATWDAPFIITTSVKFFEALFADRPGDCRKLHNLADSIVIFDEAQSLPLGLTSVTLRAINELCRSYRMTVVFSTATQPAFDALSSVTWQPREIAPSGREMYGRAKRVSTEWRLQGELSLSEIANEMLKEQSTCGIFNIRRHAREVYRVLRAEEPSTAFLLTTDLCLAHRRRSVQRIRERLAAGESCRVAATQCIEAGVDLDFETLFRALAPLESIVQAAGRCNRNGRLAHGRMTVFEPADAVKYPESSYANAANQVKRIVMDEGIDIESPDDIERYYRLLFSSYRESKEAKALMRAIETKDYEEVARIYRLIPDVGEHLIVPYADMREQYRLLRTELLAAGITPGLMKRAAPLTVTVFNREELSRYAEPIMLRERGRMGQEESGYWLLRAQYEDLYTEDGGLELPERDAASGRDGGFMY